jgi:hypothetical protein
MSKLLLLFTALIILSAGAYLYFRRPSAPAAPNGPEPLQVELSSYSDSGQLGTAILTENNGTVTIEIVLEGYDSQVPQPSHIHTGVCPRIGPVVHKLTDVQDGRSITVLNTTLTELLASNPDLNVNVHQSYDRFDVYTACGNLP